MTEQEDVHEILREFDADEFNLAREVLLLRKQEIYLEGQNADLRKRVDELELELHWAKGPKTGYERG